MDGERLKRALRELFDAQVMNHGDYNVVYGRPSGPGPALGLGYRRTPLELVLCPVDLDTVGPAAPVSSITLANVATVADTGIGYQVQSVTGFRTWFEVDEAPRVPADSGDGTVVLEQGEDAEDFHEFMGHFMDVLDAYYAEPGALVPGD